MTSPDRVPAGVPRGGEFAARERNEGSVHLIDPWSAAPEEVDAIMKHNEQTMAEVWDRAADPTPESQHVHLDVEEPDLDDWVSDADADLAAELYFAPRD